MVNGVENHIKVDMNSCPLTKEPIRTQTHIAIYIIKMFYFILLRVEL